MKQNRYCIDIYSVHLKSLISLHISLQRRKLLWFHPVIEGKRGRLNGIRWLAEEKEVSLALAQVHAISNLAWDWRHSRVGPLEGGRMQLCTTPALKGAAFIAVHFMLPADTPHCLLLQWREREQLPTHSA